MTDQTKATKSPQEEIAALKLQMAQNKARSEALLARQKDHGSRRAIRVGNSVIAASARDPHLRKFVDQVDIEIADEQAARRNATAKRKGAKGTDSEETLGP